MGVEAWGGTVDEFRFAGIVYACVWRMGGCAPGSHLSASALHGTFWFCAVVG